MSKLILILFILSCFSICTAEPLDILVETYLNNQSTEILDTKWRKTLSDRYRDRSNEALSEDSYCAAILQDYLVAQTKALKSATLSKIAKLELCRWYKSYRDKNWLWPADIIDLLTEDDKSIRTLVVEVLINLGSNAKDGVEALANLVDDTDADAGDRVGAAQVLNAIGPEAKGALEILKKHLKDNDPQVKIAIAAAIARIEGK
ncbi:MAG: HEAT repeat domain-containing protein [Planctomycetota bacterium]